MQNTSIGTLIKFVIISDYHDCLIFNKTFPNSNNTQCNFSGYFLKFYFDVSSKSIFNESSKFNFNISSNSSKNNNDSQIYDVSKMEFKDFKFSSKLI